MILFNFLNFLHNLSKIQMMNGSTWPLILLLLLGHLVWLSSAVSSAISSSYSNTSTSSYFKDTTTTTTTEGDNSFDDQDAMDALKKAISTTRGNNNLPNWDVMDYCSWHGVICDHDRLRVISINLSSQHLTGALPSEALNSLTYLNSLLLQNNNFYGDLPCLANLSFLIEVDLSSNIFTTVSPGGFSNLTSLRNLSISNNTHLSPWNFPSGLVDSTSLLTLLADNANINGPIPEFLGSFRSLHTLNLSHNNFTGNIPNDLGLANIDISNNKLSSRMPVFRAEVSMLYAENDVPIRRLLKESGAKRSSHIDVMKIGLIIIGSIAGFILGIPLYFVIFQCWMKRWWGTENRGQQDIELGENNNISKQLSIGCLKKFAYQDLVTATNNFDTQMKLGSGGSSNVFRGVLSDSNCEVAVKLINNTSAKLFESEVKTLGSTRHCNVVRMVGYCLEGRHKLIVYEYMVNGSLDKYIARIPPLTWDKKKNIIKQIAKGLQYVHLECLHRGYIVHRDVKPHNVLLDENYNAKLSDFGLAQIVSSDKTRSTDGGGTIGYLAPEVFQTGKRSLKADVYSFGVVVLEIVFGKRIWAPTRQQEDSTSLIDLVKTKLTENKLHDLISMGGTRENDMLEGMKEIVMLALWCLNCNRANRPSMTEVVNVLEGFTCVPEDKLGYTDSPSIYNTAQSQPPIIESTHSEYQPSSSVLSGPR